MDFLIYLEFFDRLMDWRPLGSSKNEAVAGKLLV
jgi:hypothetical protein